MIDNIEHGPNYDAVFARATDMFIHGALTDHGIRTITIGLIGSLISNCAPFGSADVLEQIAGALDALEVCIQDRINSREVSTDSPFFLPVSV